VVFKNRLESMIGVVKKEAERPEKSGAKTLSLLRGALKRIGEKGHEKTRGDQYDDHLKKTL